jgi:hypothetical protein
MSLKLGKQNNHPMMPNFTTAMSIIMFALSSYKGIKCCSFSDLINKIYY